MHSSSQNCRGRGVQPAPFKTAPSLDPASSGRGLHGLLVLTGGSWPQKLGFEVRRAQTGRGDHVLRASQLLGQTCLRQQAQTVTILALQLCCAQTRGQHTSCPCAFAANQEASMGLGLANSLASLLALCRRPATQSLVPDFYFDAGTTATRTASNPGTMPTELPLINCSHPQRSCTGERYVLLCTIAMHPLGTYC